MSYHLFLWEAEYEQGNKDVGGELKYFIFNDEYEVMEYLNQLQKEMDRSPATAGEFGLVKKHITSIKDLLDNGYLYVVKGVDMSLVMNRDGMVVGFEGTE